MADVTYSQGVMVERGTNDPAPAAGEPVGAGLAAMKMLPYVLDGDTPVKLNVGNLGAIGGSGTTVVVVETSTATFASREKFRSE